eukprot:Skav213406  [mRNA]  locus=scaffold797:702658:711101:- [translate_table: standard]
MAPGMDPAKLAGLNPDGCVARTAAASVYEIDCLAGFAVRSWQVSSTQTIDYSCCAVAPSDGEESPITTRATLDTSLQGSVPLYQLAALNYVCPTGQALRKFKINPTITSGVASAEFLCINVPLLRQVREINEQLQTVQWDQFRGSWVLARVPNVQVRTPIANILNNKAVAPCGANQALETFAFGNHGNENQISTVNTCREIIMDDNACATQTVSTAPFQAECLVGEEVVKKISLTPIAANKPNPPFYSIEYTCCPATKSAAPDTQAQCSSTVTATRPAGTLTPWQFVLTEPDMAIDCQERMLTGFTINYPTSTSIQINYTCCSAFHLCKSSLALSQWYKTAGKKLTDSVEGVFAYRNASSESVATVRKLVETFVAQRRVRQERLSDAPEAGGRAPTRPEFIQALLLTQKQKGAPKFCSLGPDLSRVVSMVGAANPVLYGNSFLEERGASSLLVIRWNQISAAMAEAHRKQSLFADSKKRALKAAKEALNAAEGYIHCKGSTVADLQMSWQRAVQLSDESGSVLLDAWGSTQEAHELLETAASQGLLQDMADMATVPTPEVKECLGLVSLLRISHYQGVKAIDKALSPVLVQVLVLDVISRYQEREIKRMDLQVGQKRQSVRIFMEQLGGIAKRVARPGPEGLKLAARAMNLFGSQICPAPAGCEGMLLNMSQLTDSDELNKQGLQGPWVSSQPGDFLLQKLPTLTPCKAPETVPIQPHAGLEMLQKSTAHKEESPVDELKAASHSS